MSLDKLYSKPGHLIRRSQQIAVAIFLEELSGLDITPVQYASLLAIQETPEVDATRLSDLIAFDRSTLGSVLERLEEKKLIVRSQSADDRRVKRLKITANGERLLKQAEGAVERTQTRILEPLTSSEQKQFINMLKRIVALNNQFSRAPQNIF